MIMDLIPRHKLADPVTGEAANDNQILHFRQESTQEFRANIRIALNTSVCSLPLDYLRQGKGCTILYLVPAYSFWEIMINIDYPASTN